MTLTAEKVDIFKSDDPFFNREAARKSYDLVMKMDDEEARFFTTTVVLESLWDTIEKNQRTLQTHLDRTIAKRVERVSKALSDSYISKRMTDEPVNEEEALAAAGALSLIAKAVGQNQYAYGRQFEENQVLRNQKGQFSRKPKKLLSKPLDSRTAQNMGIKNPTKIGPKGGRQENNKLSSDAKARYHSDYMQIAQTLDLFDDDGVSVVVRNHGSGTVSEREVHRTDIEQVYDPETESVERINARPVGLGVGGASFNLVSALGGDDEAAGMFSAHTRAADAAGGQFRDDWTKSPSAFNSSQRTYDRMAAGSKFVGAVAPAGSKVQLAAWFGEYVGNHGPEAEKIIGPHARKTAYRYRGTEKQPSLSVTRAWQRAVERAPVDGKGQLRRLSDAQREELGDKQGKALRQAVNQKARKEKKHPHEVKLSSTEINSINEQVRREYQKANPVRRARENRTDARKNLGEYLRTNGPKGEFYQLQVKSGHLPPSEGILIDSKGIVRAQAVGYADDHYLPFNMKNLSKLRGGEYIRSRSVGGPTSEDIYTGLVTGASALTVSSRSGTFIVEFEDDFRGTKRYNDKAKRMVDRYEKLLDAVQSGQVERADRQEIPLSIRRRIEADVDEEHYGAPKAEREKALRSALTAYRTSPEITEYDREEIKLQARKRHEADPQRSLDSWESELTSNVREQKEFNYQLNGRGYEAALKSLQEQFPYYIKSVQRVPVNSDSNRGASAIDLGYVQPRHNRPAAAQAGYFDQEITGEGKVPANQTNYQNWGVDHKATGAGMRTKPRADEKTDQTSTPMETESGEGSKPSEQNGAGFRAGGPAQSREQEIKSRAAKTNLRAAGEDILTKLQSNGALVKDDALNDVTPAEFGEDLYRNGESSKWWATINKFVEDRTIWTDTNPQDGFLEPELRTTLRDSLGGMSGASYTPQRASVWGSKAPAFGGTAYDKDKADPPLIERELDRVGSQGSVTTPGQPIRALTSKNLESEFNMLRRLKLVATEGRASKYSPGEIKRVMALTVGTEWDDLPPEAHNTITLLMRQDEVSNTKPGEHIQRLRALREIHGLDGSSATAQQAVGQNERSVSTSTGSKLRVVPTGDNGVAKRQKRLTDAKTAYEADPDLFTSEAKSAIEQALRNLKSAEKGNEATRAAIFDSVDETLRDYDL